MTNTGSISIDVHGGIGHVTIGRPGKLNSLSLTMWTELPLAIDELARNDQVRLIALRGANGTFSSGADLKDVLAATKSEDAAAHYCSLVGNALLSVVNSPVTTVALIEGTAAGGGAELSVAADLRIMTSSARMMLPLAKLGIVPDRLTIRRVLSLLGPELARSFLILGEQFNAQRCQQTGLVGRVVEPEELVSAAEELAYVLDDCSPLAVDGIRQGLLREEGIDGLDSDLMDVMQQSLLTGDASASASAFLNKSATTSRSGGIRTPGLTHQGGSDGH